MLVYNVLSGPRTPQKPPSQWNSPECMHWCSTPSTAPATLSPPGESSWSTTPQSSQSSTGQRHRFVWRQRLKWRPGSGSRRRERCGWRGRAATTNSFHHSNHLLLAVAPEAGVSDDYDDNEGVRSVAAIDNDLGLLNTCVFFKDFLSAWHYGPNIGFGWGGGGG